MYKKVEVTPVAASVPFDNSTNGFSSTDVQAAIEEAKSSSSGLISEVSSDPVSPVPGETWVLRTVSGGSPIGLLLALTYTTYTFQLSYKTQSGRIVRTTLA